MELSEIYNQNCLTLNKKSSTQISFEVFPPKNGDISDLFEELRILKKYNPALVSMTYGASGNGARFSQSDIRAIRDLELNLMPHFTCISLNKQEIEEYIISIENMGIENILILRGDIPQGLNPSELDFVHANELVEFVRNKTTLSIGVAGYPEGHIESPNMEQDMIYLKKKVESGASAIYTQLFFDNSKFYNFVEQVKRNGIDIPVVAGIMPIRSVKQIEKMISVARVTVPKKLKDLLDKFPNDTKKIGVEYAISQCQDLVENEVKGLHFFTLNHSDSVSEILDNI